MKFIVGQKQYKKLLKYVCENDQNPDGDSRCQIIDIEVDHKMYEVLLCFNRAKKQICICMVNREQINDENLIKEIFGALTDTAMKNITKENRLYKLYREKIEPATECCELNQ